MKKIILVTLLIISSTTLAANGFSFKQAKTKLKNIYHVHPSTFYCQCKIIWQTEKKLTLDKGSCGYKPRNKLTRSGKVNNRAKRIEWEHVVSAWEFGHQLQCWQNGGRKNCKKISKFTQMEGDLHNLVPSIGEINGDRSNFKFGMIAGEKKVYGQCDAEVDFKKRVFEPAYLVRGDIARIYFYFEQRYGLKLSKQQRQLYDAWDKQDPVSKTECDIQTIKASQLGWENTFVASKCKF